MAVSFVGQAPEMLSGSNEDRHFLFKSRQHRAGHSHAMSAHPSLSVTILVLTAVAGAARVDVTHDGRTVPVLVWYPAAESARGEEDQGVTTSPSSSCRARAADTLASSLVGGRES
jgi:hypothetical protein